MSVLNDMLNIGLMGEPQRLDYIIREHDKLQRRLNRLEELLSAKGLITNDDRLTLEAQDDAHHEPKGL